MYTCVKEISFNFPIRRQVIFIKVDNCIIFMLQTCEAQSIITFSSPKIRYYPTKGIQRSRGSSTGLRVLLLCLCQSHNTSIFCTYATHPTISQHLHHRLRVPTMNTHQKRHLFSHNPKKAQGNLFRDFFEKNQNQLQTLEKRQCPQLQNS